MSDVKNYPYIIPDAVLSVNILNQTNSIILAGEEIILAGITQKFLVQHTIIPCIFHKIEVLSGPASDSVLLANFTDTKNNVLIDSELFLDLQPGAFLLTLLPDSQFNSAPNIVLTTFENMLNLMYFILNLVMVTVENSHLHSRI